MEGELERTLFRRDLNSTFYCLHLNEMGGRAVHADFPLKSIRNKKPLKEFEVKCLNEALETWEYLQKGYESSQKDKITFGELDNLRDVEPFVRDKKNKELFKKVSKVLPKFQDAKEKNYVGISLSKKEYEYLSEFFDSMADFYLTMASLHTSLGAGL